MTIDYSFAPVPHQLLIDSRVSSCAMRLWGIIHHLKWNRQDPEPEAMATMLGVAPRSVWRWLQELEQSGWLQWNRNSSDASKRYNLRHNPTTDAEQSTLDAIRQLLASGQASLEAIATLMHTTDSGVSTDSGVTTTDRRVSETDTDVTTTDRRVSETDTDVTNAAPLARSNALNGHSSEDQKIQKIQKKPDSPPPARVEARKRSGGGGAIAASVEPRTETEQWLIEQGMHPTSAKAFGALALTTVQYDFQTRRAAGESVGSIVSRWKTAPPVPPAPPAAWAEPEPWPADDGPAWAEPEPPPEADAEEWRTLPRASAANHSRALRLAMPYRARASFRVMQAAIEYLAALFERGENELRAMAAFERFVTFPPLELSSPPVAPVPPPPSPTLPGVPVPHQPARLGYYAMQARAKRGGVR